MPEFSFPEKPDGLLAPVLGLLPPPSRKLLLLLKSAASPAAAPFCGDGAGSFECNWIQIYYMGFHTATVLFTVSMALMVSEVQLGVVESVSLGVAAGKHAATNTQALRDALGHMLVLGQRGKLGMRVLGVAVDVRNFWRFCGTLCTALYLLCQHPQLLTW